MLESSPVGTVSSLIASVLIALLFTAEVWDWVSLKPQETISIDRSMHHEVSLRERNEPT